MAMSLWGFTSTICHPVPATAGYAEPLAWSHHTWHLCQHSISRKFDQLEGEYTSDGCSNVPAMSIPIPSNIPVTPTGHITPMDNPYTNAYDTTFSEQFGFLCTPITTFLLWNHQLSQIGRPLGHNLNHIQLLVLTLWQSISRNPNPRQLSMLSEPSHPGTNAISQPQVGL
ncbi:uncharacterized protein MELLADRAFT_105999 [Melampsora larici-populina 98AG31]|uniref:Uncharacterized protein n=1 Tax=Melampsora larici-populina (strain 98AG31 / pathotype 3-4-7) TaxID=747676 RepID=F4RK18_MELLP|nr:uncharacterized protein MELLADRAFT_105999 [Melampsora larici-populina 98AG31]EGG07025.1 hypothetical protein MELLADRAFT_105999 [Melampsora larici-populina 98AG31]